MQLRPGVAALAALLVCVCVCSQDTVAEVVVGGGGGGGHRLTSRDYGVKLCGREFIRAVIFTCGGSRWRRSPLDGSDLFQRNIFGGVAQQSISPGTDEGRRLLPLPLSFSDPWADLLTSLGPSDAGVVVRMPLSEEEGKQKYPRSSSSSSPSFPSFPIFSSSPSSSSSKRKRHFSLGVAGMCCSQGCTKNDIGRLC